MAAMITPNDRGARNRGTLLLADISGYTAFLNGVAQAHRALILDADEPPPAYAVLSRLLDAMLAAIEPAFRLAKFEGDALFAVEDETLPHGPAVIDCVRACYDAFREQLRRGPRLDLRTAGFGPPGGFQSHHLAAATPNHAARRVLLFTFRRA